LEGKLPQFMLKNPLIHRFIYPGNNYKYSDRAFEAFAVAGTNAASAIPALAALAGNHSPEEVARSAVYTVSYLGPAALPTILQALKSRHTYVRVAALQCIRRLGTNAAVLIPDVMRALSDPETHVRSNATNVLEMMAPDLLTNSTSQ